MQEIGALGCGVSYGFVVEDAAPGAAPVTMLSYSLWQGRFRGSRRPGPRQQLARIAVTMSNRSTRIGTPNLHEPLEDDELDWLGDFLLYRIDEDEWTDDKDGGVWDGSMLDGLMAAVVSGPVMIPPSQWMRSIWGDFEPVWDSMADAERVLGLLMRHMNSVASHLMDEPETFEPMFNGREVKGKVFTVVDEWCEGYRRGVELAPDEWAAGGAEIAALLEPINAFTEASSWPAHELSDEGTEAMQLAIAPSVRAIHAYWLARRGDAGSGALRPGFHEPAFREPASREPIRRAEPRVGRNDPCPCGSGKKYKKCCLQ